MNRPEASTGAGARSPFAGCVILIAAMVVMVFLIVFSTASLFRQFNEIAKFTAERPVPVAVSPLDPPPPRDELAGRLASFRGQLAGDGRAVLALTADDLNLAIAAYEPFRDLRGTLRIAAIEGGVMRIAISYPLNGKPRLARKGENGWITADSRFLNGTLVARPALLKREMVLLIDTIEVPGAAVPREFIEQMSPYRITERYLTDPVLGPPMARITRVGIADGMLVMERVPGESPADAIDRNQLDSASGRLFRVLGIVACVFLVFAGIIVWLGLRGKAARGLK